MRVDDLTFTVDHKYMRNDRNVHCSHEILVLVEKEYKILSPATTFRKRLCLCKHTAVICRNCNYTEISLFLPVRKCIIDCIKLEDARLAGSRPE